MARFALVMAAALGLMITAAVVVILLPVLKRIHFEQTIKYYDGPAWQAQKRNTPGMGGLALIIGSVLATALAWAGLCSLEPELADSARRVLLSLSVCGALAFGVVGFAVDASKLRGKTGEGMSRPKMLLLQAVAAVLFLAALSACGVGSTLVMLPVAGLVDLSWAYYPLSVAAALLVVNSTALTDDVDGLCGGVTFMALVGFLAVCGVVDQFQLAMFPAALAGALLAFTLWNFYPAQLRMGRTGSMYLGGAVVSIAFCMGWPGLLPLLCGVPLIECGTVLLQLVWFKATKGKRLFRMAPLHHACALNGWGEVKIAAIFTGASAACMLLALLFVRVSA